MVQPQETSRACSWKRSAHRDASLSGVRREATQRARGPLPEYNISTNPGWSPGRSFKSNLSREDTRTRSQVQIQRLTGRCVGARDVSNATQRGVARGLLGATIQWFTRGNIGERGRINATNLDVPRYVLDVVTLRLTRAHMREGSPFELMHRNKSFGCEQRLRSHKSTPTERCLLRPGRASYSTSTETSTLVASSSRPAA